MEIEVIDANEAYTHLALTGKLDILGVGEIEDQFIGFTAARKKNAVVDISGMTFTGSMGLRLFLRAAKGLKAEKKSLILLNPQPPVDDVLLASGIQDVVGIEHNAESALAKAKS